MNLQWKIEKLSNRRLESEIAHRYHEYATYGEGSSVDRVLPLLWAEFDRRAEEGKMTDDEEPILYDVRKY